MSGVQPHPGVPLRAHPRPPLSAQRDEGRLQGHRVTVVTPSASPTGGYLKFDEAPGRRTRTHVATPGNPVPPRPATPHPHQTHIPVATPGSPIATEPPIPQRTRAQNPAIAALGDPYYVSVSPPLVLRNPVAAYAPVPHRYQPIHQNHRLSCWQWFMKILKMIFCCKC